MGRWQEAGGGGTLAHCRPASSREHEPRKVLGPPGAWLPGHLAWPSSLATPELLILEQNVLREQKWAAQWSLGHHQLPVLLLTPGRQQAYFVQNLETDSVYCVL